MRWDRLRGEPICEVLQVAPLAYRRQVARRPDPDLLRPWAPRYERLIVYILRGWKANLRVCGLREVWRRLQREGLRAARRAVKRLMRAAGSSVSGVGGPLLRRAETLRRLYRGMGSRQFVADRPNQR